MDPQQTGEPSERSAQVWKPPLLMAVNPIGSGVAVGIGGVVRVLVGADVGVGVGVGLGDDVAVGEGIGVGTAVGIASMVASTLASMVDAAIVAFTPASMVASVSEVGLASSWHARVENSITAAKMATIDLVMNALQSDISSYQSKWCIQASLAYDFLLH